MKMIDTIGKLK